jgi:hypothetical protein
MDYEKTTDQLIQEVMNEFNLSKSYQEYLDSLVKFKDFKDIEFSTFREYLNNEEL